MLIDDFRAEFGPHLRETKRWLAFEWIASRLLEKNAPVTIVETGSVRKTENWSGDGQSTILWGWISKKTGGSITTFDISKEAIDLAKSLPWDINAVQEDSIVGLRRLEKPEDIDLLYLDSCDYSNDSIDSPAHNLAELTSIYPRLKSGCLIAIDDCFSPLAGKHKFSIQFLFSIGVIPMVTSYVTVWVKP